MKIIQIYEQNIPVEPGESVEGTTMLNWTDTNHDPRLDVGVLSRFYNRRYRLVEVLAEADPEEGVAKYEEARGEDAA